MPMVSTAVPMTDMVGHGRVGIIGDPVAVPLTTINPTLSVTKPRCVITFLFFTALCGTDSKFFLHHFHHPLENVVWGSMDPVKDPWGRWLGQESVAVLLMANVTSSSCNHLSALPRRRMKATEGN